MKRYNKNKALTLVELMVAVSILSIGIVSVLHSFMRIASALNTSSTYVTAYTLLEEKMNVLRVNTYADQAADVLPYQEDVVLGVRTAQLKVDVRRIELEASQETEIEELQALNEVIYSLTWKELNKEKSVFLGTYFPVAVPEAEE